MPRFVAFLRAINVGARTVKMDRLRTAFEELGFTRVETFISSGNVVFDARARTAAALESRIEAHLQETLGFEVDTFVRSPGELARVAECRPFPDFVPEGRDGTLYVAFLREAPTIPACRALAALRSDTDDLEVDGREIYWKRRGGLSAPGVSGALLEKTAGRATIRNLTTVRKLAAKLLTAAESPSRPPQPRSARRSAH